MIKKGKTLKSLWKDSTPYKRKTQYTRCRRRLSSWTWFTKGNFWKKAPTDICNKKRNQEKWTLKKRNNRWNIQMRGKEGAGSQVGKNQRKVGKLRGICKETKSRKYWKEINASEPPFSIQWMWVGPVNCIPNTFHWTTRWQHRLLVKMTWALRLVRIWFWLCPLQALLTTCSACFSINKIKVIHTS